MILTQKQLRKHIQSKKIKIVPFTKSSVGPASIDLTLGTTLRIFTKSTKAIDVREGMDFKKLTRSLDITSGYILKPGELVLGITKEKITLPENMCGWLQSRSRFARVGLMSHITAPFICPGVSNHQVLEIYNAGPRKLRLIPGVRVCQLIVEQCKGKAKYQGKFTSQTL